MEVERSARKGERGAIKIQMAIAVIGLIGAGSLAIDIGSALHTSSYLQNVADASCLANTEHVDLSAHERRVGLPKGQTQVQLARALGINQIAITADSTAAISAMGALKAGKGEFQSGVDGDRFTAHDCSTNETVKFLPTNSAAQAGDSGRASR
jgi:hypothetical protein